MAAPYGSPLRGKCGNVGALDNATGVVGVAPGARLWGVKVLSKSGSGYTSWIIAGIDYVTAKPHRSRSPT